MCSVQPIYHRLLTRSLLCASLFLLAAPPELMAKTKALSAWETGRQFYLWTLRHPGKGLPSDQDLVPLKPLLSKSLNQLLQQALLAEERCQKASPPDTKAPTAEGDFFVNNYEGATVLNRLKVVQQSEEILLQAELAYVDKRFSPGHPHHTFRWRDRLALTQVSGHWQVKDIYFKDRPSLVTMLTDYLVELKKCASRVSPAD